MTDQTDSIEVDKSIVDAADLAELDRRWTKVKAGEATVTHDDVVRWLDTWGTSAFKPMDLRA